ncbi:hypothetical protein LEM8419_00244 [Neolewinella maritima]|uniref:VWA domain-containing protein n=1 Tax=Neolewinella maritima TaxID=1383882 RepID=A0ABN8F4F0_9BACT|nr:hypothetical protein [Neolewinella maritima]CAH0998949.1 hypothetical protein LEM8419_00244 [Neolewinella maritima]
MQSLTFEYPVWYLAVCALAGLGVALLLYFRADNPAPRALIWTMAVLRFLGYSLLAALLLSPLLRFVQTDREEPIVVLAQDVSESIGLETDTTAYTTQWTALRNELAESYEVVTYQFGSQVTQDGPLTFTDKQTNLDAVLTQISDVYGNQNLGAVILATDGIYNEGSNPAYREYGLQAPVYTIGLGDTTRRRDLRVSRVFHNRIAYLGDQFSIQIDLNARNASAEATTLTVTRLGEGGSRTVHTERIPIDQADFFTTREVVLDADRPGVQRYRIAVAPLAGEAVTANNQRDIFVDVLNARQKILILAAAPHPDVSALRQSLQTGRNNEVEIAYANRFTGRVQDYDLVVLHQLPSATQRITPILEVIQQAKLPVCFITGPAVPAPLLNAAQDLVTIGGGGTQVQGNDVSARLVTPFTAFTLSDEVSRFLPAFPPLTAAFDNFSAGPGANVLLRQRIGRVDTEYPLLVVGQDRGVRTGILLGTGLWQWRLYDYLDGGTHDRFDELVSQLTQYLTVQEDKRRFRVSLPENVFAENEPVRLDAELYNSSYELVNEPEARVVLTGPDDREYTYTFTRTTTAYTLNAGTLPVGNYRYRATTQMNGEELLSEGRFSVQAVEVERYTLEADHELLRRLSSRYGGEFLLPDQLGSLSDRLRESGGVKPLLFETVNTRSILNLWGVFALLLALFTGEWVLRRYTGGY